MLRGRKRYILLPPEECLKLELLPPGHPRYAPRLPRQAFSFYSIRVFLVSNRSIAYINPLDVPVVASSLPHFSVTIFDFLFLFPGPVPGTRRSTGRIPRPSTPTRPSPPPAPQRYSSSGPFF